MLGSRQLNTGISYQRETEELSCEITPSAARGQGRRHGLLVCLNWRARRIKFSEVEVSVICGNPGEEGATEREGTRESSGDY